MVKMENDASAIVESMNTVVPKCWNRVHWCVKVTLRSKCEAHCSHTDYSRVQAAIILKDADNSDIFSDRQYIRRWIFEKSIASVPEFTEFGIDILNKAAHDSCIDVLKDMPKRRSGIEGSITISVSNPNNQIVARCTL